MVGGPKVIIVSVHVLYISLYRYVCLKKVFRWVVGGPQSDYSVCPRPLRRVSGFWVSVFQVLWFSGSLVFRFLGFLFTSDGMGRDAELDNILVSGYLPKTNIVLAEFLCIEIISF